jgi:uncharacterized damage-inducible protein DinB
MLHQMLKYKAWADRRTLDAVAFLNTGDTAPSLAFARQQLNHMVRVEELFRARLLGETVPHASTNTDELPALDELERRITASNHWLATYADSLSPAQLNEVLHFQFVDGQQGSMTREEMLFHFVNHGTYHRGAIGHALDLAKAPRPADTYTVFIHAAEPERRKPV